MLARQLEPLGARLIDAQGWTIRPADQLLSAAQQQAVARSDYHDRSLTVREAQLLKRVLDGGVEVRYLRNADEIASVRMTKAGFIEERDGVLHATGWLAYNLGLTNWRPQPRQPLS